MAETTAQTTDTREAAGATAASTDPWAAITNSPMFNNGDEPVKKVDPPPASAENEPAASTGQEGAAGSTEGANNGTQSNNTGEPAKTEPAKTEEAAATTGEKVTPVVEFKAEDIKMPDGTDANKTAVKAEEGSWLHAAQAKGLEVKEDTQEAYNEAIVAPYIKQIEEARALSLDKALEQYKPETAAAIKLTEMGYSQEKYYSDKKYIEETMKLDDAALVRMDLEMREEEGYKPEIIDLTMEEMAANPNKLKLAAEKARIELRAAERGIDAQRNHLIQQYEVKAQEAAAQRKQEETTNIKKALDTAQSFMEVPLTPEIKQAVFNKFTKGGYEALLKDPARIVDLMLYSEFGSKYAAAIKNTAFENGRDEKAKNLSNIPPVKKDAGQVAQISNQSQNNWDAVEKNFGPRVQ